MSLPCHAVMLSCCHTLTGCHRLSGTGTVADPGMGGRRTGRSRWPKLAIGASRGCANRSSLPQTASLSDASASVALIRITRSPSQRLISALILFIQTLALYKSFTYILTYLLSCSTVHSALNVFLSFQLVKWLTSQWPTAWQTPSTHSTHQSKLATAMPFKWVSK